ncbi:MAG: NAD(P)-dependent oxidoreductase [Kiritimatiellia bacterium]
MRPERETFPINAMIEGRRVLVVGGGRVGQRKVELLLDAGARVVLVCPECVSELAHLADALKISWRQKFFKDDDVSGYSLVFACTDNKHVNRDILEAARAKKVPCCCADGNWSDGDFVTPAILRSGNVLISVSTSGRSCRQSRLIRDNLRKHLDSIASSDLFVLGTSHELAGIQERAPCHLLLPARENMGAMISQVWGVHEFFILNTCNRIEVVAAIAKEATTSGILRRLMKFDNMSPELFYMKFGYEAFEHVCTVTAGVRSQTPGEFHVVSQMKEAVEESAIRGWSGSIIREFCDTALKVSRQIRRKAGPLLDIAEIEEVCIRYMDEHLQNLESKHVLVLGTGMVGRGLVDSLTRRGISCIWGWHRNRPSDYDRELVELVQFEFIHAVLPSVEVVVSAVDVQQPLLRLPEYRQSLEGGSRVTMIDLGMPRNIDPELGSMLRNVEVIDLDILKGWYRNVTGTLDQVTQIASDVVAGNRACYERIRNSMQGQL